MGDNNKNLIVNLLLNMKICISDYQWLKDAIFFPTRPKPFRPNSSSANSNQWLASWMACRRECSSWLPGMLAHLLALAKLFSLSS